MKLNAIVYSQDELAYIR